MTIRAKISFFHRAIGRRNQTKLTHFNGAYIFAFAQRCDVRELREFDEEIAESFADVGHM